MFRGSSSHFRVDHFYIVDFHSALTFPDRVYRKAELVECAVIPDSIFSLIIQSASAVCFLSHLLPAVCYHCFEQCVDAQSPNDCNFQLVGSTLFRKFLSNLFFPGFHQHNSNYLNSHSVPSVHHLFPSQGILSFSCLQTLSIFSEVRLCLQFEFKNKGGNTQVKICF